MRESSIIAAFSSAWHLKVVLVAVHWSDLLASIDVDTIGVRGSLHRVCIFLGAMTTVAWTILEFLGIP